MRIPRCNVQLITPLYHGGYADVWKGKLEGVHVAIKVLRVFSTSDFEKIKGVSFQVLSKTFSVRLTLAVAEVLQGSHELEDSPTPKRATTVGSDDV